MSTKPNNKGVTIIVLIAIGILSICCIASAIGGLIYYKSQEEEDSPTPSPAENPPAPSPAGNPPAPAPDGNPPAPAPAPSVKTCSLVNSMAYIRPSNTPSDAMFDTRVPDSIKSNTYSQWTATADICKQNCVDTNDCQEWAWYSGGNACYHINTPTTYSTPDGGYTSGRCSTGDPLQ
jgi:hypothetical protein